MKEKTFSVCFLLDDKEYETFTTLDMDYYPEFVAELGNAFLEGRRFYHNDIGIDFSLVKYFYIYEEN